ncbi:MAG: hypothetical protein R3359_06585 [Marinirhabdus sp.]|nr:hypothetical protein [Marinirhabdus sp.]
MEPNKFEEHIRTQLQEREIEPSAAAWGKLEAQLGGAQKSNRTLWYAIAASIVALMVVGSLLFKWDTQPSNTLVETKTDVEAPLRENTDVLKSTPDEINAVAKETNEVKEPTETPLKQQPIENAVVSASETNQPKRDEIKKRPVQTTPKAVIAQLEKVNVSEEAMIKNERNDKEFIGLKVDEVVAQVQQLNATKAEVSAEDVEALLQKAQRDIATQRILNSATTNVDPASLLNDVESELERSFRDKVFDALGEGFNTVRTAVLERNN